MPQIGAAEAFVSGGPGDQQRIARKVHARGGFMEGFLEDREGYKVTAQCLGLAGDESDPTTCGADTLEQAGGVVYKFCARCRRATAV